MTTRLHFHWRDPRACRRFSTAVSLHGHTRHSREGLEFLPGIAHRIPLLRHAIAHQERRYEVRHGHRPDYASAYWTPPLHEREALRLERRQIEATLGLIPMVSLTDHDNIDAALHLQLFGDSGTIPVSVEWSVPYGPTCFHLGVHNLPVEDCTKWMARMASYTADPKPELRRELFEALAELPDVLVVMNHPLWDFSRPTWDGKGAGGAILRALVQAFIAEHREWIHAIELNGLRPWSENREVLALAEAFDLCPVSGGDRHGTEPNANVNLTCASDFAGFVDEVRRDGQSEILFLGQYRLPVRHRHWETIWDVMREYPGQPGRVHWTDRFFYRNAEQVDVPLSSVWGGSDGPALIALGMKLVRLAGTAPVRFGLRAALGAGTEALP